VEGGVADEKALKRSFYWRKKLIGGKETSVCVLKSELFGVCWSKKCRGGAEVVESMKNAIDRGQTSGPAGGGPSR